MVRTPLIRERFRSRKHTSIDVPPSASREGLQPRDGYGIINRLNGRTRQSDRLYIGSTALAPIVSGEGDLFALFGSIEFDAVNTGEDLYFLVGIGVERA